MNVRKQLGVASLWLLVLLSPFALAQDRKTFTVPFHTVHGMILLDATVNGKAAVMLLDTGCDHTMVSLQLAGISAPLKPATVGFGVTREWIKAKIDFGSGRQFSVEAVNLSAISKSLPVPIDGILGEDVLQEFSAVRIDYKTHTVELEN